MNRIGIFAAAVGLLAVIAAPEILRAQDKTITIENAWTRPTPGGAKTAAVYFTAVNGGATSDRIVSAETPAADRAEMHIDLMEGDVMRMRRVLGVDVPANGRTAFSPQSFHVMLIGLKAPLKAGDKVPLTLHFDHAGDVAVTVNVRQ
jgi:hypothetical protein